IGVLVGLTQIGQLASNPDVLTFSFGTNANQTAFVLSLVLSVLLGRWYNGIASRFQKLLFLLLIPLFFLAGFKAMWVFYPVIVVATMMLVSMKSKRQVLRGAGWIIGFLALVVLIVRFIPLPELDYYAG